MVTTIQDEGLALAYRAARNTLRKNTHRSIAVVCLSAITVFIKAALVP